MRSGVSKSDALPSPFKSPLPPSKSPAVRHASSATPLKVTKSGSGRSLPETEEQWFLLFEALRTGRKNARRGLRTSDGQLLESFVSAMASESRSEMLKCGFLVCLQENSVLFLEHDTKNMERICALLSKMLDAGSAGLAVQCQILATVTCLLCELSVAQRQPRLFEGFVELLLGTISRANAPHDAVLRSTACECLRELELLYPGLFHQLVGNFVVFAQTEMSYAHGSYVSLLVTSLTHAVMHGRATRFAKYAKKGSQTRLPVGGGVSPNMMHHHQMQQQNQQQQQQQLLSTQFLLPRPMIPFAIPLDTSSDDLSSSVGAGSLGHSLGKESSFSFSPSVGVFSPVVHGSKLDVGEEVLFIPDPIVQEIRKCVSLLTGDSTTLLCPTQLFVFVHGILNLQRVAGNEAVPVELLRQNFFRMLDLGSPLLLQALVQIRKVHPELFEDAELVDDTHIIRKMLACANDQTLPLESRAFAIELLKDFGLSCCPDAYAALWPELWPGVFDDVSIVAAKLRALVMAFSPPSRPSPPNLLVALSALSEFRVGASSDFLARAVFATLRLILARLPEQFDAVYRFLLDLLVYSPQFLPNLTESLDLSSPVSERLLTNFNQLLCGLETAKMRDYVPLAELVSRVASVDGTLLMDRVLAFLHSPAFSTHVNSLSVDGKWMFGNALLDMYRAVLVVQSPARLTIWELACQGLFVVSQRFQDVEIRDRAHFLHYVATHMEPVQVAELLSDSDTAPFMASLPTDTADMFSGASGPKIPLPLFISRPFLCFDRVAQLNGGGSLPSRWTWEQVVSPSNLVDDMSSQVEAFLQSHPPVATDPLSLQLKLRFMTAEEIAASSNQEKDEQHQQSVSHQHTAARKGTSGSVANSRSKKKSVIKSKDYSPQQHKDHSVPNSPSSSSSSASDGDVIPSCILGATVSFLPHPNIQSATRLDVSILRAKESLEFVLTASVLVPLPGSLKGQVEFSFVPDRRAGECVVARAAVCKVRVELQDLFAELPGSVSLELARSVWRWFWTSKEFAAADVVKRVARPRTRVEQVLMATLRRFVVSWVDNEVKILIFLPPGSHLLIEARIGGDSTLFFIKTDLWQLLESVDMFIQKIFVE